jgi:hypothetical protein
MTKKLEEVFGFIPENDPNLDTSNTLPAEEETLPVAVQEEITSAQATIDMADRIDVALPTVTDMSTAERELDSLAKTAQEQSERLMDLGFNVDDRNAGKIFEVAAQLLKTAVDAKTAKIEKKLKMVELQLRKARLDSDKKTDTTAGNVIDAEDAVFANRNDLVKAILNSVGQNK